MKIPGAGHILLTAALLLCTYGNIFSQSIDDRCMTLRKMSRMASLFKQDTVSVVFGGDLMMHKAQIDNSLRDSIHIFDGSFSTTVLQMIRQADLAVGNMEFTLGGSPYTGYPAFSAPDTYPEYLADCGFDVFLLANNHIFDKGADGLARTMKFYRSMQKEYGIRFTGCDTDMESFERYNPLYVRLSGIKVALINFTYGTNLYVSGQKGHVGGMSREHLQKQFSKARHDGAEILIVLPHWGTEYSLKADSRQKEWAQWLAEQGADIIIGTHPHVVQETGTVRTASGKTVPVAYSLGNVISNMSAQNTRIGLFVTLKLTRDCNGKAVILPLEYTFTWCALPGRLTDRHTTISVKEFEGRRDEWEMPYDYDNMMQTYRIIKKIVN